MIGLLTGHYHLKGHLFTLGLIDSPGCELKVRDCWILKQRVAQKVGDGWGARVPAVPFLIYSIVFYLRQIKWMWFICFTANSEVHNYTTRQQINFHLPSVSLTKCQKGIGYLGVKVFNKLPQYLKEEFDNPKKFKQSLKNWVSKHSIHYKSTLNCSDI
jgi:hypothetical protein